MCKKWQNKDAKNDGQKYLNSIGKRQRLLESIPTGTAIGYLELVGKTNLTGAELDDALLELENLGVIRSQRTTDQVLYWKVSTESEKEVSNSYTFTLPMSIGSRGAEVVELQCVLQDLGFFSQSVSCTGYFGPITHAAVADFQASKGIESIGIVGPKTRAALNAL